MSLPHEVYKPEVHRVRMTIPTPFRINDTLDRHADVLLRSAKFAIAISI